MLNYEEYNSALFINKYILKALHLKMTLRFSFFITHALIFIHVLI